MNKKEHNKFMEEWNGFFKRFNELPTFIQCRAKDYVAAEFERRAGAGQGFGSSDRNHSLFGRYGQQTNSVLLISEIITDWNDEFDGGFSPETIRSISKMLMLLQVLSKASWG